MTKREVIEMLKSDGMDGVYNNWHKMSTDQRRELVISALFIIGNNNLDDEYFEELENNLM